MSHVSRSFFLPRLVMAIVLMATISGAAAGEDRTNNPGIGYRQFEAAAYHRSAEEYSYKKDVWVPAVSGSPRPTFRIVRSDQGGINQGAVYELFHRRARFYENRDPRIGGINRVYEMFRQGDAWMFGLPYEREDQVVDAAIAFEVTRPFGLPMFPLDGDPLSKGSKWTVQAPVVPHGYEHELELAEAYVKTRKARMDTPVAFHWEDTVEVDGHQCAKIVFRMRDVREAEKEGNSSEARVEGVSYFSLKFGLPVYSVRIVEGVERKQGKVIKRQKVRMAEQLILVFPSPSRVDRPLPLLPPIPADE